MSELAHVVMTEDEEDEGDMSEDDEDDLLAKAYRTMQHRKTHKAKSPKAKGPKPQTYPCPVAVEFECNKMFTALSSAKMHKDFHFPPKHRCPYADSGCNKMFRSVSNATVYGKTHLPSTYPCPHSKKAGCHQMFRTPEAARKHGKATHGARHPGPKAEEFNCNKMFTSISPANHHTVVHGARGRRYCCPHTGNHKCKMIFLNPENAKEHGKTHNPLTPRTQKFSRCTVSMCVLAVAGVALVKQQVINRMELHKARGDLGDLAVYPNPVETPALLRVMD